jgi:hypothetical protein
MNFLSRIPIRKHPILHAHNPISVRSDLRVVRDHDDGAPIPVQVLKDPHDLISGLCVEISGWLVRENDRGVIYERSCDCNTLALPA